MLVAGDIVVVCFFLIVLISSFIFLLVLPMVLLVALVFSFPPQTQQLGCLFYGYISFLFPSLYVFLSFPLSVEISLKKKKIYNGAANYDENTGSAGFGFACALSVQQ